MLDRPNLSIWESVNNVSLIKMSITLLAWYFCIFLTNTSHLPEDSVEYVGSIPITDGMVSRYFLIPLFVPAFIESSVMLKIVTIPVWAKKRFCWVSWCLTVVASIDWIKPWGMKWMFVSDCGRGSKTDDFTRRDLRIVKWAGWHLTSYATVVTRFVPFLNPIHFVDKSNAGKIILFFCRVL